MWLLNNSTKLRLVFLAIPSILLLVALAGQCPPSTEPKNDQLPLPTELVLPAPRTDSDVSLEQTLLNRRSVRDYRGEPLNLSQVSQLLWAAQGITQAGTGFRTAPSAGATYPLETYLVVGDVVGLSPGVYRYEPGNHTLARTVTGDIRRELATAALGQGSVRGGAVAIVFTAVYHRTTQRYGERGIRYVHMEAGHAAQNVYLQAVALDLGTVTIGAFSDEQVSQLLNLPADEKPLYIMPVGKHR